MKNKYVVFLAILPLALSGCSHMPSWLGGPKEEKPKAVGERFAVLPVGEDMKTDEALQKVPMVLPQPTENTSWPAHSLQVNATAANLAGAGHLEIVTHVTIGDGREYSHTRVAKPVVADGVVYAMDASGNISAHDAVDIRKIIWQKPGVSEEDHPDMLGGGLAVDQDKLYAVSGHGVVAAFDTKTGKEIWKKTMHVPFRSAPRVDGDKLFIVSIENQLFALNAATGDILWNQRGIDEVAGLMNSVSPVVSQGVVVVPYSSGELYALSENDGAEIWKDSLAVSSQTPSSSPFSGIGGDPVVDDKVVFGISSGGFLSVYGLPNGQHLWQKPISSNNTPWLAGDYLFVLTSDDALICFVKFDGRVRWTKQLDSFANMEEKKDPIVWRGPVLVNGNLTVVGSNGQMLLVSATDGKTVDTKSIPEDIYTAPVVASGRIYLVSQDATLYELQ